MYHLRGEDPEFLNKKAAVEACKERLLGPRSTRDSSAVWFEQQERARPLHTGKRCYGITNMVEKARGASGPPAAFKVNEGMLDETQATVKDSVEVFTTVSLTQIMFIVGVGCYRI